MHGLIDDRIQIVVVEESFALIYQGLKNNQTFLSLCFHEILKTIIIWQESMKAI